MSHVAIVVPPLHGHVNPALGAAAELVRQGRRVTLHLPERFAAAARATGAELIACPDPVAPSWARSTTGLARFVSLPAVLADAARTTLPPLLAALRADPPDVLVHDQLGVAGRLAAELTSLPVVQLCTSYAAGPRWSPWTTPEYANLPRVPAADVAWDAAVLELAARCGTPRLEVADLLAGSSVPTVVFMPRMLHPAAAAYGERFTFVGPALRPELPGDAAELAALDIDERPLAYVSMGTLFADSPLLAGLDRICERGFADGAWQAVLADPAATAQRRRGAVLVRRSVPQLQVLARAAVAVVHGGMGSVLEALWHGVPMVVAPQVPEQEITANRLVALGVAVRLDAGRLTPDALREAVEHVHTDPGVRRAVQRMRHTVRASGGAAAAAGTILRQLAAHHASPGGRP